MLCLLPAVRALEQGNDGPQLAVDLCRCAQVGWICFWRFAQDSCFTMLCNLWLLLVCFGRCCCSQLFAPAARRSIIDQVRLLGGAGCFALSLALLAWPAHDLRGALLTCCSVAQSCCAPAARQSVTDQVFVGGVGFELTLVLLPWPAHDLRDASFTCCASPGVGQ